MSDYVKLTPKLHARVTDAYIGSADGKHYPAFVEYLFWCNGCEKPHSFHVVGKVGEKVAHVEGKKGWGFNGNVDKPTFTPSLLYPTKPKVCHLVLTDGIINYQNDCHHALRGQSILLPDYDEHQP